MLSTMRRVWAGEVAGASGPMPALPADGLSDTGCDDLLLFPCSGDLDQVALLAEALDQEGEMEI
jgi:hypothetical protein